MFYEIVYGVYELYISSFLEKYKNRLYIVFLYILCKKKKCLVFMIL